MDAAANYPSEYFEKNPSKFDKGTKPAEKVRLTRGHTGRVEAVSWANSDPDYVLTAGQDGKMLVWHAPSGTFFCGCKLLTT